MCVAGRLRARRQGSESSDGGAGDGDDGGLATGRAADVRSEVGPELTNSDHVYSSVHIADGEVPAKWSTLQP